MATKPKRPSYTSPKGVFKYPSLTKPDFGNETFPKPDVEFKTALVVALDGDVQKFIDKLMPVWTEAIAAGQEDFAKMPIANRKKLGGALKEQMFYEEEFDQETEEPTGNVVFKFKTKYKITDKKTQEVRFNKIGLFDAKGKPLAAGTAVYGGTVGRVSFQTRPYFVAGQGMAGLSLLLNAAQIIELVGPGNRSASSFGFGEEEGYETSEEEGMPADESDTGGDSGKGANGDPQDF